MTAVAELPAEVIARFRSKFEEKPGSCWEWTDAVNSDGYGYFQLAGRGSPKPQAHRLAYELLVGPIPAGLVIDHECHNNDPDCAGGPTCRHRRCVNPQHLRPVTHEENLRAGRARLCLS